MRSLSPWKRHATSRYVIVAVVVVVGVGVSVYVLIGGGDGVGVVGGGGAVVDAIFVDPVIAAAAVGVVNVVGAVIGRCCCPDNVGMRASMVVRLRLRMK